MSASAPRGGPEDDDDIKVLAHGLATEGRRRESEAASVCSAHSSRSGSVVEGRDHMKEARRVEDELERRSVVSGSASDAGGSEASGSQGPRMHRRWSGDGNMDCQASKGASSDQLCNTTIRAASSVGSHSAAASGSRHSGSRDSGAASGSRSSQSGVNVLDRAVIGELCQKALTETTDLVRAAEEVVEQISMQQKEEVIELKLQLEKVRETEVQAAKEMENKSDMLAQMEAVQENKHNELQVQVEMIKKAELNATEQKEDMQDEVVGLEAAHEMKLMVMEEELEQVNAKTLMKEEFQQQEINKMLEEKSEIKASLKKDVTDKKWDLEHAKAERDALRKDAELIKMVQEKEVAQLKEMLVTAKHALDGEVYVSTAIAKTSEQNEMMQQSIIQLKREVERVEEKKEAQTRNLEHQLESARSSKQEAKAADKAAAKRKKKIKFAALGAVKMPSINEEDDDNMSVSSCGHSGQVSDGDGVGDLGDFDEDDEEIKLEKDRRRHERIKELRCELKEQRQLHNSFKDEVASRKAKMVSKKERMKEQLQSLQDGQQLKGLVGPELESLGSLLKKRESEVENKEEDIKRHSEKIESLQAERDELERAKRKQDQKVTQRKALHQQDVEEVNNKLYHALEMKRVSEMRMEDTKREMQRRHESNIAGYERVLNTLMERIHSTEMHGEGDSMAMPAQKSAVEIENENAMNLLREERNDILHQLEWKEGQWQSKIGGMDSKGSQEVSDMKKEHKQRIQALQTMHAQEKQELLEKKESIQQEVRLSHTKRSDSKLTEHQMMSEAPKLPPWLAWLQCPHRDAVPSGPAVPSNCQVTCWQLLNSIPEVNAIMCNLKDLEICLASKKAYKVWGSAALHGQSLLSLLHRKEEAAWMKRATGSHQVLADIEKAIAPGFLVRDLGCLQLRTRANNPFDAVVTTAHLPAEAKSGRGKVIIAIIQTMVEESQGRPGLNFGNGGGGSDDANNPSRAELRPRSRSEISDDINPSDSVSRVAERRFAY